eukprot:4396-Eustigmatos_ZCMA.PRE.1
MSLSCRGCKRPVENVDMCTLSELVGLLLKLSWFVLVPDTGRQGGCCGDGGTVRRGFHCEP